MSRIKDHAKAATKAAAKTAIKKVAKKAAKAGLKALFTTKVGLIIVAILAFIFLTVIVIESLFGQIFATGDVLGSSKPVDEISRENSAEMRLKEGVEEAAQDANYANMYVYRKNRKLSKIGNGLDKDNLETLDKYGREREHMISWGTISAFQVFKNNITGSSEADMLDLRNYGKIAKDLSPLFLYFPGETVEEYKEFVYEPVYHWNPYVEKENIVEYAPVYKNVPVYKQENVLDHYKKVHLSKKDLTLTITWSFADAPWRKHDEATGQDMRQVLAHIYSHHLEKWNLEPEDAPPTWDWYIGLNDKMIYRKKNKLDNNKDPMVEVTHRHVDDSIDVLHVSDEFEMSQDEIKMYKVIMASNWTLYKDPEGYLYKKEAVLDEDGNQVYGKVIQRKEDGSWVHNDEEHDHFYKREWTVISKETDYFLALSDSIKGSHIYNYSYSYQEEDDRGLWRFSGYTPLGSSLFLHGMNLPANYDEMVTRFASSGTGASFPSIAPEIGKWRNGYDRIDSYIRYFLGTEKVDDEEFTKNYTPLRDGPYGGEGIEALSFHTGQNMPHEITTFTGTLGDMMADLAFHYLDRPYILGSVGPSTFDCSGLIIFLYKQFSVELPWRYLAHDFYTYATPVSKQALQRGDLGFIVESGGRCSHVGIYVGDGMWIDASSSNKRVVHRSGNFWTHFGRLYIEDRLDGETNTQISVPVYGGNTQSMMSVDTMYDIERKMIFEASNSLETGNADRDWLWQSSNSSSMAGGVISSIDPDIFNVMTIMGEKYDIPVWFIAAIIQRESSFNPQCKNSTSGAYGLMQVMPANWEWLEPITGYNAITDRDNIMAQIENGCWLVRYHFDKDGIPLDQIDWNSDNWKEQTLPGLKGYGGFTTARQYTSVLERTRKVYAEKLWQYAESFKAEMLGDSSRFENGTVWPTPGFMKITSAYGYRKHPVTGQPDKFHAGIDIGSNWDSTNPAYREINGKPAVSIVNGTVTRVQNLTTGYGKNVIVSDDYYDYLYAHLSGISVTQGQKVNAGQEVGKVGSTGQSTGPHLHFEIRKKGTGETVDPLTILKR